MLLPALLLGLLAVSAAVAGDAVSLPDMDDFAHINTLVVPDKESPIHGIHHFYMNPKGLEVFAQAAQGQADYPEGTVIVGKVFKPEKTQEGRYKEGGLAAYTYMEKAPGAEGTDDTGGWRFAMLTPEGTDMGVDPVKNCFGCHKPHKDTDYVLSTPLP
jgi:hypothetical protein